ncbi:MAG TPA: response regulator [Gemmatimonadaceae bacterium]|nr:response regulator [Gemmatimonadaceae bacterium]
MNTEHALPILVVDDNHDSTEIVRHLLEARGYRVFVAYNGDEALEVFERVRPALVLLDVMMPGRSGWDVCRIMKQHPQHGRKVRIMMLTARTAWDDKQAALTTGADDFVTKPLSLVELAARVERNLALIERAS